MVVYCMIVVFIIQLNGECRDALKTNRYFRWLHSLQHIFEQFSSSIYNFVLFRDRSIRLEKRR